MIRRFCDCCGSELVGGINTIEGGRLTAKLKAMGGGPLSIEVITSSNGVANDGDFCKYCVIDALSKLDDRPRIMEGRDHG